MDYIEELSKWSVDTLLTAIVSLQTRAPALNSAWIPSCSSTILKSLNFGSLMYTDIWPGSWNTILIQLTLPVSETYIILIQLTLPVSETYTKHQFALKTLCYELQRFIPVPGPMKYAHLYWGGLNIEVIL